MGYPDATYALLGRESAFLADALEVHYEEVGQDQRVVRLNAIGPTLDNMQKPAIEYIQMTNPGTVEVS